MRAGEETESNGKTGTEGGHTYPWALLVEMSMIAVDPVVAKR